MRLAVSLVLPAAAAAISLAACSSSDSGSDPTCRAGETNACLCPGGEQGLAGCAADGTWDVCVCDGAGGTGGGGGSGGTGGDGGTGGVEPVAYRYVTSELRLPTTAGQAATIGVDVDGDGTIDNAVGSLMGVYPSIATGAGDAVATGQLIQLHELRTPSVIDAASATWAIFAGAPAEPPDYSGNGAFTPLVPAGELEGAIVDGSFEGEGDNIAFAMPLLGETRNFTVLSPRIEAAVGVDGCAGMAGGAIPADDFTAGFAAAVNLAIAAEGCGPDVPCSETLTGLLEMFDANDDFQLTVEELNGNFVWRAVVAADIDSDDDGTNDALSIGWGFTCVQAQFNE